MQLCLIMIYIAENLAGQSANIIQDRKGETPSRRVSANTGHTVEVGAQEDAIK